jgi:hypothetical protein
MPRRYGSLAVLKYLDTLFVAPVMQNPLKTEQTRSEEVSISETEI